MKLSFSTRLRKEKDKLVHISSAEKNLYETLKDMIPQGAIVDVYIDVQGDSGSLAQLAKVHAIIREIALHSGQEFKAIKLVVKERAGLCWVSNDELFCKSFGDCSKDELSLAIQEAILLGEQMGLSLG